MKEERIEVTRTAHYTTIGKLNENTETIWFLIHGYGQSAKHFIRKFEPAMSDGDFLIAPDALSRYYVHGTSGRVGGSWMTKEHREDEIRDHIAYLDQLYEMILGNPSTPDGVRIHVLGFSQGVATAVRWVKKSALKLNSLILWSGTIPVDFEKSSKQCTTYFIYGLQDEYLHLMDHEQQLQLLEQSFKPYFQSNFDGKHEIPSLVFSSYRKEYQW